MLLLLVLSSDDEDDSEEKGQKYLHKCCFRREERTKTRGNITQTQTKITNNFLPSLSTSLSRSLIKFSSCAFESGFLLVAIFNTEMIDFFPVLRRL